MYSIISITNESHLAFYFNVDGAIFGTLIHDSAIPEGEPLYTTFLATKLLPCGRVDGKVQKFTGNWNEGQPPGEHDLLTAAIHSFAHFMAIISKDNMLLCDFQGKLSL